MVRRVGELRLKQQEEEEEGKEKDVELPRFGAVERSVEEEVSLERTSNPNESEGEIKV